MNAEMEPTRDDNELASDFEWRWNAWRKANPAPQEAALEQASAEYFGKRPQIDTMDRRNVFKAGFDSATPIAAQPAAAGAVTDEIRKAAEAYGKACYDRGHAMAANTLNVHDRTTSKAWQQLLALIAAPVQPAPEPADDGACRSCVAGKCVTGPKCVTLGRDDE
jgi:hypothetical protein